jgi:hypothetical protein
VLLTRSIFLAALALALGAASAAAAEPAVQVLSSDTRRAAVRKSSPATRACSTTASRQARAPRRRAR